MFKRIELTNYQSFDSISLDLTGPDGHVLPHVLICGENGSGKTGLMGSMTFLRNSIHTVLLNEVIENIGSRECDTDGLDLEEQDLAKILKRCAERRRDIRNYSRPLRMLGTRDPMTLRFLFTIDGRDLDYTLSIDDDGGVVDECLRRDGKERFRIWFPDDSFETIFDDELFRDPKYHASMDDSIVEKWGDHTFLSILERDYRRRRPSQMARVMDPEIERILAFIDTFSTNVSTIKGGVIPMDEDDFDLVKGTIGEDDFRILRAYGNALTDFLSSLCPDILKAEYRTFDHESGALDYELMIWRRMADGITVIPERMESDGTKALVTLLPMLLNRASGRTAVIDDLDSGLHRRLASDLLRMVVDSTEGQLIATVHDPTLLESMNTFRLEVEGDGRRTLSQMGESPGIGGSHRVTMDAIYRRFRADMDRTGSI